MTLIPNRDTVVTARRQPVSMLSQYYCAGAAAATCLAFVIVVTTIQNTSAQHLSVVPNASMSHRSANMSTSLAILASRRRRRYVRFPALSGGESSSGGGRLAYTHSPRPASSQHSGYNSWVPVRHKQPHYQVTSTVGSHYTRVPHMGQRSPRLVFRDPDIPGTIHASSPYYSQQAANSLQDLTTDVPRGCGIAIGKLGPSLGAQRRIVGGDEAGFGSFPWQAYIRIGTSRCGGSLVNHYHVVTAGHCVARATARQVQVTLGDYVINSAVEPLPAYTFGVREIRVHPYFKFTPQADRFDVAVLRLDRPVQYMPHIAPICLPEKGEDFLGQYGWAAGWGALQAGSRLRPKTLQAVDVPVIDNRLCERWHKSNGINVIIYDEMMCAGYRGGGKDSCQGDSGGPLMTEKVGRWYLIGIVSAGYSCAQRGQPGIYHRVAHTVDWISYIINTT
ncbi:serine proteinase stubble isoform X3 [Zootermopsis nevadensis]|uniref:serine proteinase stubble isoform X3 n=1 Tax=Zootermopsis nevadensis TaxID=136037 RepID=UPI000B8E9EBF|nr:serine proteinase stubble isoform X3 [Zootermopsis nevadensis]